MLLIVFIVDFIVFILGSHVLYCFIYPLVYPLIYPLVYPLVYPLERGRNIDCRATLSVLSLIISPCFRAHPCSSVLVGGWHTSSHAPRRLRYIPDTYPIHTRHIPDTYVYPMNTPRIPHEYSVYRKKGTINCNLPIIFTTSTCDSLCY